MDVGETSSPGNIEIISRTHPVKKNKKSGKQPSLTGQSKMTEPKPNAFKGKVYVLVNANYLNPLDEDTANTMPGDLYGLNSNYETVALGSYGMINVELRGMSGQKLQIANTAKISLPIHPNQMATATSQVPMWSFN